MILTLHTKNTAKVASVTLSRAYFMLGPHTQAPRFISPEKQPSHVVERPLERE
jgi:hypothetical protein